MSSRQIRRRAPPPRGPGAGPSGLVLDVARDLLFLSAIGLYIVIVGQNWGVYAAAVMVETYRDAFAGPRRR